MKQTLTDIKLYFGSDLIKLCCGFGILEKYYCKYNQRLICFALFLVRSKGMCIVCVCVWGERRITNGIWIGNYNVYGVWCVCGIRWRLSVLFDWHQWHIYFICTSICVTCGLLTIDRRLNCIWMTKWRRLYRNGRLVEIMKPMILIHIILL